MRFGCGFHAEDCIKYPLPNPPLFFAPAPKPVAEPPCAEPAVRRAPPCAEPADSSAVQDIFGVKSKKVMILLDCNPRSSPDYRVAAATRFMISATAFHFFRTGGIFANFAGIFPLCFTKSMKVSAKSSCVALVAYSET